jgi:hypothetical protein
LFPNLYISDLYISHVTCQQRWGECDERASQAFFLGMMVVWTPALLFLAWVLRFAAFGDSLEVRRRLRAGQVVPGATPFEGRIGSSSTALTKPWTAP